MTKDVQFPAGVIVIPTAASESEPGVVWADPDEVIDLWNIDSLHVQVDLLSYDEDFTVSGGGGGGGGGGGEGGGGGGPSTGRPVMAALFSGMDRDPHAMAGGDMVLLGNSDPMRGTAPSFLKLSIDGAQAVMRYAGWVVMNFSTDKPAMVRLRGLARRR